MTKAVKSSKVSQSNELTEAVYYLPLQAKRVLWQCLIQSYIRGKNDEDAHPLFTVKVADYAHLFGVNIERASRDVKKGISQLANSSVTFLAQGDYDEVKIPWLALAGSQSIRGQWDVNFNPHILPYMQGLKKQFTTYSIVDVGKLTSTRAIRLYESLCQWREKGLFMIKFDELAHRFELPDSQRRNMAEFKRTFLEPALKKINQHTSLSVTYRLEGKALHFDFLTKD